MASIHIEATSSDGTIKRHPFTARPLTSVVALRAAIRLAGDEARRLEVEGAAR
jgi:hypothetical protein